MSVPRELVRGSITADDDILRHRSGLWRSLRKEAVSFLLRLAYFVELQLPIAQQILLPTAAARFRDLQLHQLPRLETRVAVLADDEVAVHRDDSFLAFGLGSIFQNIAGLAVVHGDAQRARDLDDRPRHVDVGA